MKFQCTLFVFLIKCMCSSARIGSDTHGNIRSDDQSRELLSWIDSYVDDLSIQFPNFGDAPKPTYVKCGNGESSCKGVFPKLVNATDDEEKYSVRCCYDDDQDYDAPYTKNYKWGCSVWADSLDECHDNATFMEAVNLCGSKGGRLCTEDEVDSKCARGTGCDFDGALIWTSNKVGDTQVSCGNGESSCKGFLPKLVFAENDEEKHSVRCCYDDDQDYDAPYKKNYKWGCSVWANSLDECHDDATFMEAVNLCGSKGGRLCTEDEVNSKCARGTGCDFDGALIWTSPSQDIRVFIMYLILLKKLGIVPVP